MSLLYIFYIFRLSHSIINTQPLTSLRPAKDAPGLVAAAATVPATTVVVVAVASEDIKEQLVEATLTTKKAFTTYRREAEAEEQQAAAEGAAAAPAPAGDKGQEEGEMSVIITIMQPILRLMQLLCENHNRELQVSRQGATAGVRGGPTAGGHRGGLWRSEGGLWRSWGCYGGQRRTLAHVRTNSLPAPGSFVSYESVAKSGSGAK